MKYSLLGAILAVSVVACASEVIIVDPEGDNTDMTSDDLTSNGGSAATDTGTQTETDASDPAETSTQTGGETPNDCVGTEDCVTCCAEHHPEAYASLFETFAQQCGCSESAPCSAECTDFCSDIWQGPDANCEACLNDTADDPCQPATVSACEADPTCVQLLECSEACFYP